MNRCYLGLGSNQKNPERQLRSAIKAIKNIPFTYVTGVSSFYWNTAWGNVRQQRFCNVVIEIHTRQTPKQLLAQSNLIEKKQGRIRKQRWGPRTLDIDIILYGHRSINTKTLKIPHPGMLQRDFVLIPLFELNPKLQLIYKTTEQGL